VRPLTSLCDCGDLTPGSLRAYLIPLNDLPKRVNELDSEREIVVHCKTVGRSARAAALLPQAGFK
jgi:adenylyltransferase/sulfurtransferase